MPSQGSQGRGYAYTEVQGFGVTASTRETSWGSPSGTGAGNSGCLESSQQRWRLFVGLGTGRKAQGAVAEEEGRAEDGQTSMGGAGLEDRRQQVREEEAVEGED